MWDGSVLTQSHGVFNDWAGGNGLDGASWIINIVIET